MFSLLSAFQKSKRVGLLGLVCWFFGSTSHLSLLLYSPYILVQCRPAQKTSRIRSRSSSRCLANFSRMVITSSTDAENLIRRVRWADDTNASVQIANCQSSCHMQNSSESRRQSLWVLLRLVLWATLWRSVFCQRLRCDQVYLKVPMHWFQLIHIPINNILVGSA